MSGNLTDAKEGVMWTFSFDGKQLLLAPAEQVTLENKEQYVLSGLRLLKILSEFDPQLKIEEFKEMEN